MDGTRFDRLARAWFAAANRRAVLRVLTGLPLGAVAANLFDAEPSDAAQRDDESTDDVGDEKQSRKQRCRRRKGKGRGHHGRRKSCQARHGAHHKPSKKKPCQPDPMATTCDGRCGPVTNNCQQTLDCGPCVCAPPCPENQVCCGDACFTGICCGPADCASFGNNCDVHQCTCGNGPACSGETPVCCDFPTSVCTNTDTDEDNCGACGNVCSGDTPVCWDGACVCGDVCPSGCQFSSVAEAVEAALPGSTITICAGDYVTSVNVFKPLTLRGAGAGVTILRGPGASRVMEVRDVVLVQNLTITGGSSDLGGGILNRGTLTLAGVVVTGNESLVRGGGIYNFNPGGDAMLVLDNSHVTVNTAAHSGGGIHNDLGLVTLTNGSTVTDNTAPDGGGIGSNGGTVTLEPGSLVCDNSEPQCSGFAPPSGFCGACP